MAGTLRLNEKKRRSALLHSDEVELMRRLFEGSTDAVQLDDTDGRVIYANGSWLSLFHVDADDVLGAKWTGLVKRRQHGRGELTRSWSRTKKGTPTQGTVGLRTEGNGREFLSYTRMPVQGESGDVWAVLSIFRSEGLVPGDQDVADITHDLSNVFTAIMAGAQLIERQNPEDQGLASKVDLIQRSAQRGLRLLGRLGPKATGTAP